MKTVMKVLVVLVLSFIAVPGICPAQNVWKFNADSCRARALENNAAVRNADLKVQAAVETKRSAVAKYFPSVSANVSAFLLHDYLVDVSTSDVTDGKISVETIAAAIRDEYQREFWGEGQRFFFRTDRDRLRYKTGLFFHDLARTAPVNDLIVLHS